MKVAIMQPYIFPYLTYFQLVNVVDKFVLYDDVNYIKGGWINRNYILLNGKRHLFTIPLKDSGSFTLIKDIRIATHIPWKKKFLKTLEHAYGKAAFFTEGLNLINQIVNAEYLTVSELARESYRQLSNYFGMTTQFVEASSITDAQSFNGQKRVIHICKQIQARQYINLPGGRGLYSKEDFAAAGLELSFIQSQSYSYPQLSNQFERGLSIIDVVMNVSRKNVMTLLNQFNLSN